MKGVILAGGSGTRLDPFTRYINKHLLPIGKFPMIYWPIMKLKEAGIQDIFLICNRKDLSTFMALLGGGEELGVTLTYSPQQSPNGIADGLSLAESFIGDEKSVVLLGDNIFETDLIPYIKAYEKQESGAMVLLKEVPDPQRYGIATINKEKHRIDSIEEKPKNPKSNLCATGIYFYDSSVFDFIKKTVPSKRGELEITDVNNYYINYSILTYEILTGWWIDAGTPDSLYQSNKYVFETMREQIMD